ncbi:MAG: N-acetylmuramoyl-L-alanine amidase, partial [Terrisporobacter sp.]
ISGFSLYILKNTNAPAVLIEYGFMDNWEDARMMCSDKFQKDCAIATAKGICDSLGVKYVSSTTKKPPISNPNKPDTNKVIYRVVCGSYSNRDNAESTIVKFKKMGYSSFVDVFKKDNKNYYRVIAGSYTVKANADKLAKELKGKGYSPFIAN